MTFIKNIENKWKSILWPLLIVIISNNCYSQDNSLKFKRISVQDGLSQNFVRCIYQDETGFMWFGTSNGLNKYDGYEFKVYPLGNVNVNAIQKKSDTELWICSDLGIFILDQKRDTIYSFSDMKGIPALCMLQDSENRIWFGTNNGLYKFNISDNKIVNYTSNNTNESSLSNNFIRTVFEDSEHNIWIGTAVGLNCYQKSTNTFKRYLTPKPDDNYSGDDVMSMCEDRDKRIWIGTGQNGVKLLIKDNENRIQFKKIINGYNIVLLLDKQNNLWIGRGSNGGLLSLDLTNFSINKEPLYKHYQNNKLNPESLSDNFIFSLYEDNSQDIWIGTYSAGVNFYSYRNKKFHTIKEGITERPSIKNDQVYAIFEEENFIWFGTEAGIDRYNKIEKTSKHYEHDTKNPSSLSTNPIFSLYKDSKGNLWAGTWAGGLNMYNYKNEGFKHYFPDERPGSISNRNVFSITEDSKGNLWIGTVGGGLNKYDYLTDKFTHYKHNPDNKKSLYNDGIEYIMTTRNGRLLISSYGSIDEYNYTTDDFDHYELNKNNDNISLRYGISIFEDSKKNIWVATNMGLLVLSEKKEFILNYTVKDGLPDDKTLGILEDEHENLWIATNKGLSKFIKGVDHPTKPEFINFTSLDGLSGNEFKSRAMFKNKSGVFYFGTSQGCTYFHPDSIFQNKTSPPIVFTEIQLLKSNSEKNDGLPGIVGNINRIDTIELEYNNSDFTIKYAALNYLNPQKNQYKYKLEGYDKDWINADKERSSTYKNLPPGLYKFMVYGSNNDGIWSSEPKSIHIIVRPPWWRTLWFKLIVVLFVLAGLAYVVLKIINKIKSAANRTIFNERNQLKTLIDNMPDRVIIKDRKSRFLITNKSIVNFLGAKNDKELLNKTDYDLHPKELADIFFKEEEKILSTGIPIINKESERIVNGQRSFVSTTKCPLINPKGEIIGLVCIISDITAKKNIEFELFQNNSKLQEINILLEEKQEEISIQNEELEKHRNHLQKLVDEQTKELKAALYKAKESDRLKSIFLANMSHEIRTPMNAIIGFSEILIKTNKDETQKEYLNSIKLSGQTLLSLINDILDLSKIEAGKMTIKKDIISFKSIFSELEHIFKVDAELKGLNLFTEVDENFPEFVELDELRTRQVLINLINNAIKFTHKGYIKVKANTEFIEEKVNLIISVEDTGIGIKKSDQERIFEAFNQSDSYDGRNYEGTGLGLAIISRIVPLLGGTIKLDSKIDKGSIFIIEIKDVKIHKENPVSRFKEIIDPDCISFEAGTVLVVDDKDINIKVAKGLLKPYNLKIIEAHSGLEAIDVAMLKKPDLILMDLKMKEMSGYEATKVLKSKEKTRNIPIVVLTASVLGFNENLLDEYKFAGYLPKPVELSSLITELSRFLPHKNISKPLQKNIANKELNVFEENNELKNYLKDKVLSTWEQLQKSRTSILEKEFTSQIIEAGQIFKNKYLEEKGRALESAIKSFNIEKFTNIKDELGNILKILA